MQKRINWPIAIAILLIHVLGVTLPWFWPSWAGLAALVVCYCISGLGITLGFHRLFTHDGFRTYLWVRVLIIQAGMRAIQGTAKKWIADHRRHHRYSDQEGDPHSPRDGFWHSHILWTMIDHVDPGYYERYAPKQMRDPLIAFMSHPVVYFAFVAYTMVEVFLIGLLLGWLMGESPLYYGLSLLAYGWFLRVVVGWHSTWLVNSATHVIGYRNYNTRDCSTNHWLVALLTFGEGWHNNHHHSPRSVNHGHKSWEFDSTFLVVRLLKRLGLAWDLQVYDPASVKLKPPEQQDNPTLVG